MTALGPGDLVEALYDWADARTPGCAIRRGALYVVERIVEPTGSRRCLNGHDVTAGLFLQNVPAPRHYAWCAGCFRPIGRPAQGLINSINQWIAEGAPLNEGEFA